MQVLPACSWQLRLTHLYTSVYKLTAKPAKLIMGEDGGKTKRGELSDGVERTSHALTS